MGRTPLQPLSTPQSTWNSLGHSLSQPWDPRGATNGAALPVSPIEGSKVPFSSMAKGEVHPPTKIWGFSTTFDVQFEFDGFLLVFFSRFCLTKSKNCTKPWENSIGCCWIVWRQLDLIACFWLVFSNCWICMHVFHSYEKFPDLEEKKDNASHFQSWSRTKYWNLKIPFSRKRINIWTAPTILWVPAPLVELGSVVHNECSTLSFPVITSSTNLFLYILDPFRVQIFFRPVLTLCCSSCSFKFEPIRGLRFFPKLR